MSAVRLGDFIQEKAFNMRAWMRETLDEPQLLSIMDSMLLSDFVAIGDMCVQNKGFVVRHDFNGLLKAASGTPLFEVGQRVRARADMHDKFWRYLELFETVTEGATFQQSNNNDAATDPSS